MLQFSKFDSLTTIIQMQMSLSLAVYTQNRTSSIFNNNNKNSALCFLCQIFGNIQNFYSIFPDLIEVRSLIKNIYVVLPSYLRYLKKEQHRHSNNIKLQLIFF